MRSLGTAGRRLITDAAASAPFLSKIGPTAQYALNVQYAPAAAIPNQLMVGSSRAAR